jgi:hypothetical protein
MITQTAGKVFYNVDDKMPRGCVDRSRAEFPTALARQPIIARWISG